MNHEHPTSPPPPPPPLPPLPPGGRPQSPDELDALLRQWHALNAERAAAGRDRLLKALAQEPERQVAWSNRHPTITVIRRIVVNRYSPLVAALIALAVLLPFFLPRSANVPGGVLMVLANGPANIVMAPEGGRLDAVDAEGNVLGPCALKHTDVKVAVSGLTTRVSITQQYHNPHKQKIEAVYTFPLSDRAAVDRMRMTIGDRVVEGEVHERKAARQIYEAAKAQNRIASLLDQERPNIFTQSVSNIEPGADIDIQISYVELVEQSEGTYSFSFPTVVSPRYIPGYAGGGADEPAPPVRGMAPSGLRTRPGLVLLAPASVRGMKSGDLSSRPALTPGYLGQALATARPIYAPTAAGGKPGRLDEGAGGVAPEGPISTVWYEFDAAYPDGSSEPGTLYTDGTGHIAGRWFSVKIPAAARAEERPIVPDQGERAVAGRKAEPGAAFSPDTDQVPDASRITPMPVRPPTRAGHDISISVTIDTGGPGIIGLECPLHQVVRTDEPAGGRADGLVRRTSLALDNKGDIPNRDFVLNWRQTADTISESVLTHTGTHGNFFSITLQPPARVTPDQIVPRELVFVLDTSGSMSALPIEKAKMVMEKAIAAMRPADTFNVITFAGATRVLWNHPRPATEANKAAARGLVAGQSGGGGTEMMTAINAALKQTGGRDGPAPVRIVMFLTDGEVGNDFAIIDAIRENRATTRVFSFGIGNSVNRFLINQMARAGGGEAEFVLLHRSQEDDAATADAAVERFVRRISSPVLANIGVQFSPGLEVLDVLTEGGRSMNNIPDLYDLKPLTIIGRYTRAGAGTATITGQTGAGAWRRVIPLTLPEAEPAHDTIATIWARTKIESLMNSDLKAVQSGTLEPEVKDEIIRLGETFGLMSQYTSFVAVDKLSVTIGGQARLVHIPIELPQGTRWEGYFGDEGGRREGDEAFIEVPQINLQDVWMRSQAGSLLGDIPLAGRDFLDFSGSSGGRELVRHRPGQYDPRTQDQSGNTLQGSTLQPGPQQAPPPPPPPPKPEIAKSRWNAGAEKKAEAAPRQDAGQALEAKAGTGGGGGAVGNKAPPAGDRAPAGSATAPEAPAAAPAPLPAPPPPAATGAPARMVRGEPATQGGYRLQHSDAENVREGLERSNDGRAFDRREGADFKQVMDLGKATEEQRVLLIDQVQAIQERDKASNEPELARARVVRVEQIVLRARELVTQGNVDDAKRLADALAAAAPDYALGVQLRDVLGDATLAAADRDQRLDDIAAEARKSLAAAERAAKIRRRLDRRLWPLEGAADLPTSIPAEYNGAAPEGATFKDGGILVTLLVADTGDAAVKALADAGLRVESISKSANVVVGTAPLGKVVDLALIENVRRVEPTKFE